MFPRATPVVREALHAGLIVVLLSACGAPSAPSETPVAPPASAVAPPASAEPPASAAAPPPSAAPSAVASSAPAAEPAPSATAQANPAEDKARSDFAVEFVSAVAKRDRAALGRLIATEDFCKAMLAEKPPKPPKAPRDAQKACVDLMTAQNQQALALYTKLVPQTFKPGPVETMPIAPEKGIWMVLVRPAGFDPKGPDADKAGVTVTVIELSGKRFVVFPQKVEEKKKKIPPP